MPIREYIEHIFAELYSVPESYKLGYLKIKIMELLLVLSGIDPKQSSFSSSSLSKTQVDLAKNAAAFVARHMDETPTVDDIATEFSISSSHLQKAFKGVYGVPIYSYMRVLKMQAAAMSLTHTDMSVLEIANNAGYGNASKFSSAFKRIIGEAPLEYRKMHRR